MNAEPLRVAPEHSHALEKLGEELKGHEEGPEGHKKLGDRQVGLRDVHRFRPADVGIQEKYTGEPGEGDTEDETDDEAGHVENDPYPALEEMGKHHHPDVTPLPEGVGKAAKGERGHEVALEFISNVQGSRKSGAVDNFGDGDYQGDRHHDSRYPAIEPRQIVDKIDYLFHVSQYERDPADLAPGSPTSHVTGNSTYNYRLTFFLNSA